MKNVEEENLRKSLTLWNKIWRVLLVFLSFFPLDSSEAEALLFGLRLLN